MSEARKVVSKLPCRSRGVSQVVGIILLVALVVAAVSGYYIFYKGFFRESKRNVNMDVPQITIQGPTTGYTNHSIVLSVKNSGNVDFLNWSFVQGSTVSGTDLLVGDQVSTSATLNGPGPWIFKVQAYTAAGKVVEDSWAVGKP